jgi:hypothetical protein
VSSNQEKPLVYVYLEDLAAEAHSEEDRAYLAECHAELDAERAATLVRSTVRTMVEVPGVGAVVPAEDVTGQDVLNYHAGAHSSM